jgi:hypothetical protein
MANNNPDTKALKGYQAKRTDEKCRIITDAVNHALASSEGLSVAGIARKTGISRSFIQNHETLRRLIDENRQVSAIRHNASIEKARENARIRALENKLQAITDKCKTQALKIKSLNEQNLQLKLYIEQLNDSNIVPLHPREKK